MQRTGIYVYSSTTLNIETSEPIELTSLDNRSIPLPGGSVSTAITPGIYKVISSSEISVAYNPSVSVITRNTKDTWPDPPLEVITALNVSAGAVTSFFVIPDAKSARF